MEMPRQGGAFPASLYDVIQMSKSRLSVFCVLFQAKPSPKPKFQKIR